jgi:hypothetical protein
MTAPVPADLIEGIVGATRHPTRHYAKAVSSEQVVYILHSAQCRESRNDLRECVFSRALDNGINVARWAGFLDVPVRVTIDRDRHLVPVRRDESEEP